MSRSATPARIVPLRQPAGHAPAVDAPVRAQLLEIREDGLLNLRDANGTAFLCECLDTAIAQVPLAVGDRVVALLPQPGQPGVVLGRIGPYRRPEPTRTLQLETTDSLSLKCGASSIELRADGKLLIRGEDVLIRARGTQRIKAGTVSIN